MKKESKIKKDLLLAFLLVFLHLFRIFSLVEAKSVHLEYQWAEPSINPSLPNETEEAVFTTCFACHKSLGATGGGHLIERKYCEDCHVPGQSGPFVYYEPATLYLNFNYNTSISSVYYHIPNLSSSRIIYKYKAPVFVPSQSNKLKGGSLSSCFDFNPATGEGICHGISSLNSIDGYFGFNATGSPKGRAYHHAVEKSYLPDSKNCLYCHAQSNHTIVKAFANPSQINASHFNASSSEPSSSEPISNEQCYHCHVDTSINFTSFHVMGPEPEIIYLQNPQPTPPPPTPLPLFTPSELAPTTAPPETLQPTTEPLPETTLSPQTALPTTSPTATQLPAEPSTQPPAQKTLVVSTAMLVGVAALFALVVAAIALYIKKKKPKGP